MAALLRCLCWLWAALAIHSANANDKNESLPKCERLKLKTPLTYTQEKASRDLSGAMAVVVEQINRVLEGVVDVEVEWEGSDLHGRVGEHVVKCKVYRLASVMGPEGRGDHVEVSRDEHGREVIVQCFLVPFTILDTNECALPSGHAMRHKCQAPAVCVNTIGSYECICPRLGIPTPTEAGGEDFWAEVSRQGRTAWEKSFNSTSDTSCPSSASTFGCCPTFAHSTEGRLCRSAFRCPLDPCRSGHDCSSDARCEREDSPQAKPNYHCRCPAGLMGNGHACRPGIDPKPEPKVKFDGVTPTAETIKNNYYCGCTKPVVDACAGFPPCKGNNEICAVTANNVPRCVCKPGYVDDGDGYGCVDETPPLLRLRHDPHGDRTLRLKQGDLYKEYAVEIVDDNAEEYARSLKITYSDPLPPGCLARMGEFHVNYTVATPWTSPPYVRITRRVVIEDIDECSLDVAKYESQCPELIPQCDVDAGATCVNTIGSYTCRCPKYTSGDGFKAIHTIQPSAVTPQGYKGGTGCVDTSKPVISLLGPNPKVFKVCKCGGLTGIMGGGSKKDSDSLCAQQRGRYDSELKEMVRSTAGAELCATSQNPHPTPTDCVQAVDHTYKGSVDISKRVTVGEPVQKSMLLWSVPYDVLDEAGNQAKTVWRDVVVEEVDVFDMESRMRADLMAQKDKEVEQAVANALVEERKRNEKKVETPTTTTTSSSRNRGRGRKTTSTTCPPCPECDCPTSVKFDPSLCDSICEKRIAESLGTCLPGDERARLPLPGPFQLVEDMLPPHTFTILSWCFFFGVAVVLLRWTATALFGPAYDARYSAVADLTEREMRESVMYHRSPPPANSFMSPPGRGRQDIPQSAPPHLTRGVRQQENGFFSPPTNRFHTQDAPFWTPSPSGGLNGDEDIYQSSSRRSPATNRF